MKLNLALASITGAAAFMPNAAPRNARSATNLYASKGDENAANRYAGGSVAFISGLLAAGQIAFADPTMLADNTVNLGR
jgi:poly(3-hydroxybutyrate) depolymerase